MLSLKNRGGVSSAGVAVVKIAPVALDVLSPTTTMGSRSGLETHDLTALVSSTGGSTVYPNEETILSILQTRFRADEPYVRIASTTLVVVNPLKALASVNDLSAAEYRDRLGVRVAAVTVWRALRRLGLSHKKSPAGGRAGPARRGRRPRPVAG